MVTEVTQNNNSTPAIRPAGLRNQSIKSPAGDFISSPLTPYLEFLANVSKQPQKAVYINSLGAVLYGTDPYESVLKKRCPGYFVPGSDDNGHRVGKELFCGFDWCGVCGKEWSPAHQRRFARWLLKACQIKSLGCLVFTIPEELRKNYRTRKALKEFGHNVQEMMKVQGYSRGLRRWHFFGDKSEKYNPHLNVFIEADYLNSAELETIKKVYAVLLGVEMADVHYEYSSEPEKKVHMLKYVTRATFLDYHWDAELALELKGFRNQVSWGRGLWNQEPVWSLDDLSSEYKHEVEGLNVKAIEALESGVCHLCGLPIIWAKAMPIGLLKCERDARPLGAGYWELTKVDPPGHRLKFARLEAIQHWRKILRLAGVNAVPVRERETNG